MSVTPLFIAFAVVAVAILALAAMVGAVAPRPLRMAALAVAAFGLGAAWLAGAELLGRPKPIRMEILRAGSNGGGNGGDDGGGGGGTARVVAAHSVEGRAIWLWLILPGDIAPRAYELPWSVAAAQALRSAQSRAEDTGTGVEMRAPFRRRNGASAPVFHVPPPPPLPPKTGG